MKQEIEEELLKRKFKDVPDYILKKVAKLPKEEQDKLGTPITTNHNRCNCKDGGRRICYGWDSFECARCGGLAVFSKPTQIQENPPKSIQVLGEL